MTNLKKYISTSTRISISRKQIIITMKLHSVKRNIATIGLCTRLQSSIKYSQSTKTSVHRNSGNLFLNRLTKLANCRWLPDINIQFDVPPHLEFRGVSPGDLGGYLIGPLRSIQRSGKMLFNQARKCEMALRPAGTTSHPPGTHRSGSKLGKEREVHRTRPHTTSYITRGMRRGTS